MSPPIQFCTPPLPWNPAQQCQPPPADPRGPGMTPSTTVDAGPNEFTLGVNGPDPDLAVGGSHDQQEHQRDALLALSTRAAASYASRALPGDARLPTDGQVAGMLDRLDTNPPIGLDGQDVTHAVYQSQIPNTSAQEAYEHFVNNPNEVLNAGGMEIRPPTERLVDGERYMLEVGGPPPTWLPVEIRLDADNNAITIDTLDGHVLRGTQTFTFTDCEGGTTLTQDARFQASTRLVGDAQEIAPISTAQHESWEFAHREIYEQFNGDRDYAGMGTGLQPSAWIAPIVEAVRDPGGAADAGIDVAGEIANETIDHWGGWAGDAMDWAGIPGGDTVRDISDTAGDVVSDAADWTGDRVEDGINWLLGRG